MNRLGEPRPVDTEFYAARTEYVRQGDLFTEIPLGMNLPANAFSHKEGRRKFVSGPFDVGFGLLLTPSCSMAAQGKPGAYAHAFRTLAPVLPLEQLVGEGAIKETAVDDLREYDHLINYMYLPAQDTAQMPESVALLYAPTTLHHDYLEDRRISQLSVAAAVHLKRQLAAFYSGSRFSHEAFDD